MMENGVEKGTKETALATALCPLTTNHWPRRSAALPNIKYAF